MGRGSSKSGGGGGGLTPKTQVTTQDGTVLDLSENPLVYGKADAAVTGALRTALEAQETKRLKAKSEYGVCFDENGNMIGTEQHGGKGSVKVPSYYMTEGSTLTHNHPRGKGEEGLLGGTFSDTDMNTFAKNDGRTMRASAAEGTYSITKGKGFNQAGFRNYYNSVSRSAEKAYDRAHNDAATDLWSGKISYAEYHQRNVNAFNKMLVTCHNGLLAGQQQFGYTYTLEART